MAVKITVKDRIPTYPGRVTLTPVSGQANTYDMARADSPIEDGTVMNAALFNQKADRLVESITVYVNGASGSDTTGDGSSALPFATIQKAVDALPKYLDGYHAQIDIAAGVYEERVMIDGFQGGRLTLGANRNVIIKGLTILASNMVRINVPNITYSTNYPDTLLYAGAGSNVYILNPLTLTCSGASVNGMGVEQGSTVSAAYTTVTVTGCASNAVMATTGGRILFERIAGSNNTAAGLRADRGGVITYNTRTLEASTVFLTSGGGRVFSAAQANAPSY